MTDNHQTIAQNLHTVHQQIREAEQRHGRPAGSVQLLAVSKTRPISDINAAIAAEQRQFGENYLQEALEKVRHIHENGVEWHFIGAIQSNKTRPIAEHFHWVHTIDRLKIAQRLSEQRDPTLPPLNVCIQVNTSGETQKAGIAPETALELAQQIQPLPNLTLRGLMTIPAPSTDFEQQRQPFRLLRQIKNDIEQHGIALDTLSMGMSNDMEAAIAEGATLVRIGTAIFGERNK